MAKIDVLTEALYKLIHRLAGDSTTTDAQIEKKVESMSFTEVCETLIEEVSDGDLALASGASTLATLNDTTITSAENGQVLKYNGSKWVNAADTDTDTDALEDLTDVNITEAANHQILAYNSTSGKWENISISVVDGTLVFGDHEPE